MPRRKVTKAAIFDLDGTLVDTAPAIRDAVNRMLHGYGVDPVPLDTIIKFIGRGVPTLVARSLAHAGVARKEEAPALSRFNRIYGDDPVSGCSAYAGVRELLAQLVADGWSLGVCTNKPEAPARTILRELELDGFFASIIGGDRLAVRKPEPDMLLACLAELDADISHSVFVGDSSIDEQTAQAAVVRYGHFDSGYGTLAENQADFRFSAFGDLLGGAWGHNLGEQ